MLRFLMLGVLVCGRPALAQLCTASATGIAFGVFDPSASAPSDITAGISVSCQAVTPVSVSYALQITAGGGGSFAARSMGSPTGRLSYQIYLNAARTTVWGDGTGGSATVNDGYALGSLGSATRTYTVYGRIPARQRVAPNVFSDVLTVLVVY